ncbi:uncharacterized protein TNIN_224081 [Trichonephila inaurata madagascariensis]|uniref:Uncharacterized protein n=1 Tax=Trichonephila inaurata madagascariensis TaxID=2747483 RepID=A0A8X7C441_9ARAC|nr:uncharacterized protein TNIN_224081 [Trichonephila inaurata madagascariensis]
MVMEKCPSGKATVNLSALYDELVCMLGRTQQKWGDFLIPLVESCLPKDVLMAWERNRTKSDERDDSRSLENLISFNSSYNGVSHVLVTKGSLVVSNPEWLPAEKLEAVKAKFYQPEQKAYATLQTVAGVRRFLLLMPAEEQLPIHSFHCSLKKNDKTLLTWTSETDTAFELSRDSTVTISTFAVTNSKTSNDSAVPQSSFYEPTITGHKTESAYSVAAPTASSSLTSWTYHAFFKTL